MTKMEGPHLERNMICEINFNLTTTNKCKKYEKYSLSSGSLFFHFFSMIIARSKKIAYKYFIHGSYGFLTLRNCHHKMAHASLGLIMRIYSNFCYKFILFLNAKPPLQLEKSSKYNSCKILHYFSNKSSF